MEKRGMKISKMVGIYIVSVICLLGITAIVSGFMISAWMNSASYSEPREVERDVEEWIAGSALSGQFDPSSFPQDAGCIIVTAGGSERYSSFSSDEDKLREFAENNPGTDARILQGQDVFIRMGLDGETAFIHYSLGVENEYVIFALILALFVLDVMIPTLILIRIINRGIRRVEEHTEKLKSHDLSVENLRTGIRELDEIAASIDDLKQSLSESLDSKWKDEQRTKAEMAQIAHDLKTPLTIIRGNADLLLENADNDDDRESIGCIIQSAESISRSILEILEK